LSDLGGIHLKQLPDHLVTVQRQLTIFVLAIVTLLLVVQLCAFFSDILRVLGIALLFSYMFIGLVDWLSKYLRSRVAAVIVVYGLAIIGTAVGALVLVPVVMSQVTQLLTTSYDQLPQLVDGLTNAMLPIEKRLHAAQIELKAIDLVNGLFANIPKIEAGMLFTRMSDMAVSTMTLLMYGLSIFVVSFYFLLDGNRMQASIIKLFPRRHEQWLQDLALEIDKSLQAFFRGQIVLGLGFGALMVIVFTYFGVHYALLLGLILGVWEVIPVIGPPIGFIPAMISVGIHGMDNVHLNVPTQLLLIFIVFQGLQWLKDNIVAPRYIGNVIGLHPVVIFIAIMVGAKIDGMLGIIFALPAACAINVLINHLHVIPLAVSDAAEEATANRLDMGIGQELPKETGAVRRQSVSDEALAEVSKISQVGDEHIAEPSI
jgi:predicted PurR-regulated permease PerM